MATKQVEVKLSVGALMQIKGPLDRGAKQCDEFARRAGKSLKKLEDLKGPIRAIEQFRKLDDQWRDSRKTLDKARQNFKKLHAEINNGGKVTKKQRSEYERTQKAMVQAERAAQRHGQQVARASRQLGDMGLSVRNLASAENRLQAELKQTESHVNRNSEAWKRRAESARLAQDKLQKYEAQRNKWAGRAAVGAGVTYLAKRAGAAGVRKVYSEAEYERGFTRFGQKTDLDPTKYASKADQTAAIKDRVTEVSAKYILDRSVPAQAAFSAAEAGMSAGDIESSLESWSKVSVVAEAAMDDLVRLTDGHIRNLQIPAAQIEKALAAQYSIGASGKFEMDDMARYGAALGAKYEALKFTGMEAVTSMSAALQVSMNATGEASIAANNLSNFLSALAKEDTQKRFAEAGLDIESEWKDALKYGQDPLLHMAKVIEAKGGADLFRTGELFGDEQARSFALALVGSIEDYQSYKQAGQGGEKKLNRDVSEVLNDPQARLDRLGRSYDRIAAKLADKFLPSLLSIADKMQPYLDSIERWMAENSEAVEAIVKIGGGLVAAAGAVGGLSIAVAGAGLAKAMTQGGWIVLTQGLDGLIERYGKVERGASRAARTISRAKPTGGFRVPSIDPPGRTVGPRLGGAAGLASSVFVVGIASAAIYEIGSALEDRFLKPFSEGFRERAKKEQENLEKTNGFLGNLNRLVIETIKGKAFADDLLGARAVIKPGMVEDMADAPEGTSARAQQSRFAAMLSTTADSVQQADVGGAMAGQAMAIKQSPIDAALREKADQIRAVRFSASSGEGKPENVTLPGRAKGGPVKAGHAYMVGEKGPEPFVPGQDGTIIPNDALREGRSGGAPAGLSINAPIIIHARPGMDEMRIASLVEQKISEIMRRALAESYQSASYS